MHPKKRKTNKKNKEKKCEEEITDKERLEAYGIFPDDENDGEKSEEESWRNYA